MRRLALNAVIGALVLMVTQIALAETKTFVMPDGSKVSVDVPKGMTYTREEAVRSWEAVDRLEREGRAAGEARKKKAGTGDSTVYLEAEPRNPQSRKERWSRTEPAGVPNSQPAPNGL